MIDGVTAFPFACDFAGGGRCGNVEADMLLTVQSAGRHRLVLCEVSFAFKFVSSDRVTKAERKVFDLRNKIAALVGDIPKEVQYIKVSETMRPDFFTGSTTQGLWDEASRSIIILRKQLGSLPDFAGTLLHEVAHAKTGYDVC